MKKRILALGLILGALAFAFFYTIKIPNHVPSSCLLTLPLDDASPETVEFAWDLHSVFLKKSVFDMITTTIFYNGGKIIILSAHALYDYIQYLFTGKPGKTLQLIWDMQVLRRSHASGAAYAELFDVYKPGWGTLVLTITDQYTPTPNMITLITDLHALGYTQRIATNADHLLYNQQKSEFPELFSYLDGGKIVEYNVKPPWTKKPHIRFFQEYQKTYNPDGGKTIIFVDNSEDNVAAAAQAGMIGIVFTNSAHLRQKLIALGIPLANKR